MANGYRCRSTAPAGVQPAGPHSSACLHPNHPARTCSGALWEWSSGTPLTGLARPAQNPDSTADTSADASVRLARTIAASSSLT